jgi:restriction system protein
MAANVNSSQLYESVLSRCRLQIRRACSELEEATKFEVLRRAKALEASEFESLVVRLLIAMGYGCRGQVTGRTGDSGIDGVIYVDRIGLEEILVQAKRWKTTAVGRPEVQKFCGALIGRGAQKGILITTSIFTKEARVYCLSSHPKIVLIDGAQLAELIYDCDVWVKSTDVFPVKHLET